MNQGVLYISIATLFFSFMQICVKMVDHLPTVQVVFFRGAIALILCVIQLKAMGRPLFGLHRKLLLMRGIAGTVALTGFFYTLHAMPIGPAVTIQYLSPMITILIAGALLREGATTWQWLCFGVAFSGVFIIQGYDSEVSASGAVIGVLSAAASAVAYNIIRLLAGKEDPLTIVFYFPLVTVPCMLPFTIYYWISPSWQDYIYLVLVGIFTQVAQIFMTKAYQRERASRIAIYSYLGIVYALFIGFFIFAEHIVPATLVGIVLIVLAILAAERRKPQGI